MQNIKNYLINESVDSTQISKYFDNMVNLSKKSLDDDTFISNLDKKNSKAFYNIMQLMLTRTKNLFLQITAHDIDISDGSTWSKSEMIEFARTLNANIQKLPED